MIPAQIAYITVFISIACASIYIRNIWKGKTKPNLVSWFFWMLAPFIGAYLEFKSGVGLAALSVLSAGVGPFLVILAAVIRRNAYWKITPFDIFCGLFSALALVFWIITHHAEISILFAILSDLLAAIPTYIKSWKFPETETFTPYFAGAFNNILGLLIIKSWTFSHYAFSAYLIAMNLVFLAFILRKNIFPNKTIS